MLYSRGGYPSSGSCRQRFRSDTSPLSGMVSFRAALADVRPFPVVSTSTSSSRPGKTSAWYAAAGRTIMLHVPFLDGPRRTQLVLVETAAARRPLSAASSPVSDVATPRLTRPPRSTGACVWWHRPRSSHTTPCTTWCIPVPTVLFTSNPRPQPFTIRTLSQHGFWACRKDSRGLHDARSAMY